MTARKYILPSRKTNLLYRPLLVASPSSLSSRFQSSWEKFLTMAPIEKSAGDPAVPLGGQFVSARANTGTLTQPDQAAHPDTDLDGVVPQDSLPQNWSKTRRWLIVLALSFTSLMVYVFGSMSARTPPLPHDHPDSTLEASVVVMRVTRF